MNVNQHLFEEVNRRVSAINRKVGEYHFNSDKDYPVTTVDRRSFFTVHQSATEGRTLRQHGLFHARPKVKLPSGLYTGRGWPGLAYGYGRSNTDGIVQAWDVTTVTYHCGPGNYAAIGGVLEGNFDDREPSYDELIDALAMKIDADAKVGRRLLIKYHDEWKPGWGCPGEHWPKATFAEMERQYYAEKADLEREPEDNPETDDPADTNPTPEDPEPDQPKEQPKGGNPVGCAVILLTLEALAAFAIYITVYGL